MVDVKHKQDRLRSVIVGFRDKSSQDIFAGARVKSFSAELHSAIRSKFAMLDSVTCLNDLRFPPGNRLELLQGDRAGQYSIRINRQ
jgi:toxin HigB-1